MDGCFNGGFAGWMSWWVGSIWESGWADVSVYGWIDGWMYWPDSDGRCRGKLNQ